MARIKYKNKKIEDVDTGNKGDREFLANYLKERLFRNMYEMEVFKIGSKDSSKNKKISVRSRAESIYNIILLLHLIKYRSQQDKWILIKYVKEFLERHKISKPLKQVVLEELHKDEKMVFNRVLNLFSSYYKIHKNLLKKAMLYIESHQDDDKFEEFYRKWCRTFDEELKNTEQ
ncbi:MAG: hypothetical protein JJW01_00980 [Alphaproteobacteria bacterium]|nr:hypothetical protein [Rickettsiales bacterium]